MEGELSAMLLRGGAYTDFRRGEAAARDISRTFMRAIPDVERAAIYRADRPWSSWFYDVAWDASYFILQADGTAWWVLLATDTD